MEFGFTRLLSQILYTISHLQRTQGTGGGGGVELKALMVNNDDSDAG